MTLEVFHLDISGNSFNELKLPNIPDILVTFDVSQVEISGKEVQYLNILLISVIALVSINLISIKSSELFSNFNSSHNLNFLFLKIK